MLIWLGITPASSGKWCGNRCEKALFSMLEERTIFQIRSFLKGTNTKNTKIIHWLTLIPNGTNINEAKLYLRKFYFRVVWKTFGRHQVMQHDSYLCKFYKGSVGFPTRRLMQPNNFVGAVENENITIKRKCPVECRRKFDWQYCWIELHNKPNTSWQNKLTTRCLHLAWW